MDGCVADVDVMGSHDVAARLNDERAIIDFCSIVRRVDRLGVCWMLVAGSTVDC